MDIKSLLREDGADDANAAADEDGYDAQVWYRSRAQCWKFKAQVFNKALLFSLADPNELELVGTSTE